MSFLLDTHTLIWAVSKPELLSKTAVLLLAEEANTIWVSAASAWEIATKVRIGKLPAAVTFEREFMELTARTGYLLLPISPEVALRSGRLRGVHGDPFDRMIAAQALEMDIPVISSDSKLDEFGVRRIW